MQRLNNIPQLEIPTAVRELLDVLLEEGGRPYIVGGSVRNMVAASVGVKVGRKPNDWDIEVYGLTPDEVRVILAPWRPDLVGLRFGVFTPHVYQDGNFLKVQVSLPRREMRMGAKHTDFAVNFEGVTPAEAASRRDFKPNGFMYDVATRTYWDPFGGASALAAGVIEHIGPAFDEDGTIRAWRLFKFAGRHDLAVADSLVAKLRAQPELMWNGLPENIFEEWYDWAAWSTVPSRGIDMLWRTGWIQQIPLLWMMVGCKQEPEWHPEGSVFRHTQYVLDKAAAIAEREDLNEEDTAALVFAALWHDCGKRQCTIEQGGRIRSPGHDVVSAELAFDWFRSMGALPKYARLVTKVCTLIREHMVHIGVTQYGAERRARRLADRLGRDGLTVRMLSYLVEADHSGRPPLPGGLPNEYAMLLTAAEAIAIADARPQPLVLGRHLIADLGMTPGPHFKVLLDAAYEAQLDGHFRDLPNGLAWVRTNLTNISI